MSLTQKLEELVSACFSGIWIESHEHEDAVAEIARLCDTQSWGFATWDIDQGLSQNGGGAIAEGADPLAAIGSVASLATASGTAILVMKNLHRFISSTEVIQALQHQLVAGKQNRAIIVALSPIVSIPAELEKLFVVVEHELPGREQLLEIANGIATESGELPDDSVLETVLDAAAGLTRLEGVK